MTLKSNQTLFDLMAMFPRPGDLRWIGVRERPRGPVRAVESASLLTAQGIFGDHRAARRGGRRQVTLLQHEHLAVIARLGGRDELDPALLRRNLVVAGVNVLALVGCRFRVGEAELEGTGPCQPCSRMEAALGPGGYNAMRGHGGITATVLSSGTVRLGDAVMVTAFRRAGESPPPRNPV